MKKSITAAILAGGPGSRMQGAVKPNIVIAGKTILARTLDVIRDIFSEIILLTNTPEEFNCHNEYLIVSDKYSEAGPLGGIHTALHLASNKAVFVFGGDMPLLNKILIEKQIDLFGILGCDVLVPRLGTSVEPLHSIFSQSVLSSLEIYLSGNNGYAVRDFFRTVNTKYMELEETEELLNVFSNINFSSDIPKIEKIVELEERRKPD
jgi:molybdopterin-guanine dinucleotide biosynthesis protein A